MSARVVLFIGLVVSCIYILGIVHFQTDKDIQKRKADNSAKFLYIQKNNHIEVVSKLSVDDKNSSLISSVGKLCQVKSCTNSFEFKKDLKSKELSEFIDKLLFFISDNNISKATIVAKDKDIDINFLLNDKEELYTLKQMYKNYKKKFHIKDSSSVVEVFNIENIENSINDILADQKITVDNNIVSFKTRKLLNKVFRKLKSLGSSDIELKLDLDESKLEILKDFIKNNYSWIKEIDIKKDKKNSIKIKEVLS